jgi:hypothetical protein
LYTTFTFDPEKMQAGGHWPTLVRFRQELCQILPQPTSH